jgi:hypothetical protein
MKNNINKFLDIVGSHDGLINDELMDTLNEAADQASVDFASWHQTHYEIVQWIQHELRKDKPSGVIGEDYERHGTPAMYNLAKQWTDKFEELHRGREWDCEFWDEVEAFVKHKNTEQ